MAAGSVQAGGTLQQGGGGVSCVTGPGAGHHHPDTFIVIRPDNFTHRDKSRDKEETCYVMYCRLTIIYSNPSNSSSEKGCEIM